MTILNMSKNKETINGHSFRVGFWIGQMSSTWPSGTLEVGPVHLIIRDQLLKKDFKVSRNDIESLATKKIIPLLGYGIKIELLDKSKDDPIYFWNVGLFRKLEKALRDNGWLPLK